MNKPPPTVIVVLLLSLTGCAGGAQRSSGPASVVQTCESAVYRSSEVDARVALHCGDVLEIWR